MSAARRVLVPLLLLALVLLPWGARRLVVDLAPTLALWREGDAVLVALTPWCGLGLAWGLAGWSRGRDRAAIAVARMVGLGGLLWLAVPLGLVAREGLALPRIAPPAHLGLLLALVLAGTRGPRWRRWIAGLVLAAQVFLLLPHAVGAALQGPYPEDSAEPAEVDPAALEQDEEARQLYLDGDPAASAARLQALIAQGPPERELVRRLMLCEALEGAGDLDGALEAALVVARHPGSENTHLGIMDASNTRNRAWQYAARLSAEQGDDWGAYVAFATWHPRSWCGSCWMSMISEREEAMLRHFWRGLAQRVVPG